MLCKCTPEDGQQTCLRNVVYSTSMHTMEKVQEVYEFITFALLVQMSDSFKAARHLCSYKHCRKISGSIRDWVIGILR